MLAALACLMYMKMHSLVLLLITVLHVTSCSDLDARTVKTS